MVKNGKGGKGRKRSAEERLRAECEDPRVGWKDRVQFATRGGIPVAYRPHEIVTDRPREARSWIIGWAGNNDTLRQEAERIDVVDVAALGSFARLTSVPEVRGLVEEMRRDGFKAQLNHVYFSHCGMCPPHPAMWSGGFANPAFANPAFASPAFASPAFANPAFANPAFANPAFANPAFANPAFANPAFANPAFANPAFANPAFANPAFANPAFANPAFAIRSTGLKRSSARPPTLEDEEAEALVARMTKPAEPGAPKVIVVDTGLAGSHRPNALDAAGTNQAILAAEDAELDQPDSDRNSILDGAAGHGTFIAGLITCVTPGCQVTVHRVLRTYGDGDETTIVSCLNQLESDENTILNLSFGGYVWEEPALLAGAIRRFQDKGGVVVASAGNDGTCQPSFPAALPDVVSVGAVGPTGPAAFTNYGPWVRACAPGVKLVSMFFQGFEGGGLPGTDGLDPDNFEGWAEWSGTSFAAPVVAAALARMMTLMKCPAKEAVERVIDHPSLMRLPYLGTVVNAI